MAKFNLKELQTRLRKEAQDRASGKTIPAPQPVHPRPVPLVVGATKKRGCGCGK